MDAKTLYQEAEDIAGAILEDDDAPEGMLLSDRIERAADWANMGTDGDLSPSDRAALRKIAKRARDLGL